MIQINLLTGRLLSGGRRIPLTQGQSTVVDDEDFDRLNQSKWSAIWVKSSKSYYAYRNAVLPNGKRAVQYMHREIMGLQPGDPRQVHHVNGTLDNRRENLKVVTQLEHANEHRNDLRKNASKYGVGVYRTCEDLFWAHVKVAGKRHQFGPFGTSEQARDARSAFLASANKGDRIGTR